MEAINASMSFSAFGFMVCTVVSGVSLVVWMFRILRNWGAQSREEEREEMRQAARHSQQELDRMWLDTGYSDLGIGFREARHPLDSKAYDITKAIQ